VLTRDGQHRKLYKEQLILNGYYLGPRVDEQPELGPLSLFHPLLLPTTIRTELKKLAESNDKKILRCILVVFVEASEMFMSWI